MKTFLISFIFFLLSFIFFPTCVEDINIVSTEQLKKDNAFPMNLDGGSSQWPTVIYDSTYGEIIMDYSIQDTNQRPICGVKITYGWRTHHYEPKPGKIVGVWPTSYTISNLSSLKDYYGYNSIFVNNANFSQFENALSAGYPLNKIMIGLTTMPDDVRRDIINQFGNVFGYYVDEPADQNHSMGEIRNSIIEFELSSLFVISGYKRTDGLNVCVDQSDKVLFASYHHWYETVPGVWISWPYNPDQRLDWTDMKNRYGNKFSMTWINTYEISEFDLLFGHAQNLGLEGIWIYSLDGHHTDQFQNISHSAWKHNFLKKFQQRMTVIWHCDDCPIGCDPSNYEGWYEFAVYPSGILREVFP